MGEVLSGRPVDNVNLREDAVIGRVDKWLAREFAPHRMSDTLSALAEAAQRDTTTTSASDGEAASKIAECDRKLAQYRAALDAGANPATVAGWIAKTEAEIFRRLGLKLTYHPGRRLVKAQIEAPQHWYFESVRGLRIAYIEYIDLTSTVVIDDIQ